MAAAHVIASRVTKWERGGFRPLATAPHKYPAVAACYSRSASARNFKPTTTLNIPGALPPSLSLLAPRTHDAQSSSYTISHRVLSLSLSYTYFCSPPSFIYSPARYVIFNKSRAEVRPRRYQISRSVWRGRGGHAAFTLMSRGEESKNFGRCSVYWSR